MQYNTTLAGNPFAVLTAIVAPAILTNASSVLALATSNRLARVVVSTHFSLADLDRLFDPRNYLGAAEEYVYRVVAASRGKIPLGEE